jgi:hypothetical protein
MIPRRLADRGSRARVQINDPSKFARLSIRGGLVWFPTAHNLLTRPTPVVLEHDLFPSDHCFIGARALLLISLSEGGLMCPLTARIERAPSECARSASKKGTSGYHLCFPSSSFREGWTTLALLRAASSPAYPLARRDVPFALVKAFRARSFLSKGRPGLVPNCARRTTTVSSWGFREHGEPTGPPLISPMPH